MVPARRLQTQVRSAIAQPLRGDGLLWLALALALVVRTALAYRHIERPGLQYDETLFVNAATDRQPGLFIFKEIAGVPVMVFPYIGALKSWVLAPIFSLFEVRPTTIRMPPVLLTSGAIAVLVLGVRSLAGRATALLVLAGIALNSSVFWLTRDDVGPSAFEFACKCAAVGCIARIVATRGIGWTLALVLVLSAGTFNKLNFVWTVNGIAAGSALAVIGLWRTGRLGEWRGPILAWVGAMGLAYAAFGWYYLHFHIGSYDHAVHTGSLLSYTWPRFTRGTNAALSGTAFHELAVGPMPTRTLVTFALLALFAAGTVLSLLRPTRCWPVAMLSLVTLLVAAQTLVVASATAPWHYIGPLPYGLVVAAFGVVTGLRCVAGARRKVLVGGVLAVALAAVATDASLYRTYDRHLDAGQQTTPWTPLIYAVDGYVQHTPGTIITADWGIFNQLWALSPGARPRLREAAFAIQGGGAGLAAEVAAAAKPVTVIVHGPGQDVFAGNRQRLMDILGPQLVLERSLKAADGTTTFEIYHLR